MIHLANNICINEKFVANYAIQNASTSNIKALEIRVHQVMQFNAKGHRSDFDNPIYSKRIEANALTGAEPLAKVPEGSNAINYDMIRENLMIGTHGVDIVLPSTAQITHEGTLGSVKHFLHIHIKTPFCVNVDDHEIIIPLQVHGIRADYSQVQAAVETAFTRPTDWNAAVNPPMNFDVIVQRPPDYTSVNYLHHLLEGANQWSECTVLQEWLAYG
jgi:hypothetical protein